MAKLAQGRKALSEVGALRARIAELEAELAELKRPAVRKAVPPAKKS